MKKLLVTSGFLFILGMIYAQQSTNGFLLTGSVVYEELIKLDIQLEGVDPQMAAQIPKERRTEKILHFTEEAALFENHLIEDPEEDIPMEGSGMMIKMYEPDNKTFIDLTNKKVIEQQEFMSRVFLIESDLEPEKWKMTGNLQTILEYACQEATAMVDGNEVHAWFTPQIAVPTGPGRYSNLPGLVLAVEMNDGDQELKAISIDLKPVDASVLKKPTRGKKVTREEFKAIVEEKLEEMGVESDGSGGTSTQSVVIKIQQ